MIKRVSHNDVKILSVFMALMGIGLLMSRLFADKVYQNIAGIIALSLILFGFGMYFKKTDMTIAQERMLIVATGAVIVLIFVAIVYAVVLAF